MLSDGVFSTREDRRQHHASIRKEIGKLGPYLVYTLLKHCVLKPDQ